MNIVKKVIKVLINTLMTLVIIIGLAFVLLYCVGIEPVVVLSGSMEPTIETGSLSFVNKHVQYEQINEQDIIAFKITDKTKVMHRVVEKNDAGMTTRGDANDVDDGNPVTKDNYVGKHVLSVPKVGYVVKAIQSPRGRIILITFIIVFLLAGILIGEPSEKKEKVKSNTKDSKK